MGLASALYHKYSCFNDSWDCRFPRPPARLAGRILGAIKRDVTITRAEIGGLMAGLLATASPPAGATPLTAWARANRRTLGARYASELARRRDRASDYADL